MDPDMEVEVEEPPKPRRGRPRKEPEPAEPAPEPKRRGRSRKEILPDPEPIQPDPEPIQPAPKKRKKLDETNSTPAAVSFKSRRGEISFTARKKTRAQPEAEIQSEPSRPPRAYAMHHRSFGRADMIRQIMSRW